MIYECNDVVSPLLTGNDFDAKLLVVFLIQYSTKKKKKTVIKHLLRCDYPRAHVGT